MDRPRSKILIGIAFFIVAIVFIELFILLTQPFSQKGLNVSTQGNFKIKDDAQFQQYLKKIDFGNPTSPDVLIWDTDKTVDPSNVKIVLVTEPQKFDKAITEYNGKPTVFRSFGQEYKDGILTLKIQFLKDIYPTEKEAELEFNKYVLRTIFLNNHPRFFEEPALQKQLQNILDEYDKSKKIIFESSNGFLQISFEKGFQKLSELVIPPVLAGCTGTFTCGNKYTTCTCSTGGQCNSTGVNNCGPGLSGDCTCKTECSDDVEKSCAFFGSQDTCTNDRGACSQNQCVVNKNCTWYVTPTDGPTPPPGTTPEPTEPPIYCEGKKGAGASCTNSDQCCSPLECDTSSGTPGTCKIIDPNPPCYVDVCDSGRCVTKGRGKLANGECPAGKCTYDSDCIPEIYGNCNIEGIGDDYKIDPMAGEDIIPFNVSKINGAPVGFHDENASTPGDFLLDHGAYGVQMGDCEFYKAPTPLSCVGYNLTSCNAMQIRLTDTRGGATGTCTIEPDAYNALGGIRCGTTFTYTVPARDIILYSWNAAHWDEPSQQYEGGHCLQSPQCQTWLKKVQRVNLDISGNKLDQCSVDAGENFKPERCQITSAVDLTNNYSFRVNRGSITTPWVGIRVRKKDVNNNNISLVSATQHRGLNNQLKGRVIDNCIETGYICYVIQANQYTNNDQYVFLSWSYAPTPTGAAVKGKVFLDENKNTKKNNNNNDTFIGQLLFLIDKVTGSLPFSGGDAESSSTATNGINLDFGIVPNNTYSLSVPLSDNSSDGNVSLLRCPQITPPNNRDTYSLFYCTGTDDAAKLKKWDVGCGDQGCQVLNNELKVQGQEVEIDFPYVTSTPTPTPTQGPWVQLKNASFQTKTNVKQSVPAGAQAYDADAAPAPLNKFVLDKQGVLLGNITPTPPSNGWFTASYNPSVFFDTATFIQYAKNRKDVIVMTTPNLTQINQSGIYYYNGNLTLDNISSLPNLETALLLVNGTVTFSGTEFNSNTANPARPRAYIGIVAKKIIFPDTMTNALGIFIADSIDLSQTQSGTVTTPLKIYGNLISRTQATNYRVQGTTNVAPSVFVVVDYQAYSKLLPYLSIANYNRKDIE